MSCQKMVLKPFNYTGTSCDTFGKRLPVYQTSSLPKMQCDWLNYITRSATDDVTTTEYFLCYRISLRLLWTLHVYSTISVLPGSYYICTCVSADLNLQNCGHETFQKEKMLETSYQIVQSRNE